MESYSPTFIVLCFVTVSQAFLLIDDGKCGEGCVVRLQVLSNRLHCICPETTETNHVTKDKRYHHHHNNGHHHIPLETTPKLETQIPQHVTNTPQPTFNLQSQMSTTSLCAEGCHLELIPFHYCKCPLSTATTNVQNLSPSVTNANMLTSEVQTTQEETLSTDSLPTLTSRNNQDVSTAVFTTVKTTSTHKTTHKSTIHPSTIKTTQDICDILCAQQLGGDACHCSKPGLPG